MRLTDPLRKLKKYETRTEADILRELKATRRRIQDDIRRTAAEANASTDARERERLYAKIKGHYKKLSDNIEKQISELTGKAARTAHERVADESGGKLTTRYDTARTERYFKLIHPSNGKNIAAVFTSQMADKDIRALRGALVEVFRRQSVEGLTANETSKALRDRWDELAGKSNGRRFTDKAGRQWEDARYYQMVTRTTAQRVYNEATIDALADGGELARISSDGADLRCKQCQAWEGRIIRISGKGRDFPTYDDAKDAGVFHPNCVHSLEYVDEEDEASDIARQRKMGRPNAVQLKDPEFIQRQKDIIDAGEYIDKGLTPEDARHEMLRDRLRADIGGGTFSESAFRAADKMTGEELDALERRWIKRFSLVKQGEEVGIRGGVVRVPRNPTEADIFNVLGLSSDDRTDQRVEVPEDAPEEKPDSKNEYDVVGKAWPEDFPNITVLTTVSNMKSNQHYTAAKSGDSEEAVEFAMGIIGKSQREKILAVAKEHPDAIVCEVVAQEQNGKNKIPTALSQVICEIGNLKTAKRIFQANKVSHTGAGIDHRLAFRSEYDGSVVDGGRYILIDDVVTSGASLSDLRDYIEHNGGRVVHIMSGGAAQFATNIKLSQKTRVDLETKFGHNALHEFLKEERIHGGNHLALTESEGRRILSFDSLDEGRERLAHARAK